MTCPHCNRHIETHKVYIEKGYIRCKKCMQTIEIKDNEPIKTIPKEMTHKKILEKI